MNVAVEMAERRIEEGIGASLRGEAVDQRPDPAIVREQGADRLGDRFRAVLGKGRHGAVEALLHGAAAPAARELRRSPAWCGRCPPRSASQSWSCCPAAICSIQPDRKMRAPRAGSFTRREATGTF